MSETDPSGLFVPSAVTSPAPASSNGTIHDDMYYMQDEMLVFLVGGRLFKVHRWFLEKYSSKFRDILAHGPRDGKSDETAIVLEDVTVEEFESLLNFFYLGMFSRDVLLEELKSLLAISTRYDFKAIRSQVIEEISEDITSVPPVNRISLDQQFQVGLWFHRALVEVCTRSNTLEEFEGEQLGLATTVKLLQARERYQRFGTGTEANSIISEIFHSKAQNAPKSKRGRGKGKTRLGRS